MNTTSGGGKWNGQIGIVRIYDRAYLLQVRHNFQTDAGRFDITIEDIIMLSRCRWNKNRWGDVIRENLYQYYTALDPNSHVNGSRMKT